MCSVCVTVGTYHFALFDLVENLVDRIASITPVSDRELLIVQVIELHDPVWIRCLTVGTWYGLVLTHKFLDFIFMS